MDQNQGKLGNIIQFPGKKAGSVEKPAAPVKKEQDIVKSAVVSKKSVLGTALAIALMSMAVNKYTFESGSSEKIDLASNGAQGRYIASVDRTLKNRNAKWEMQLADSLASVQVREVASTGIGRTATPEERLRWGILEEKYTITYSAEGHRIDSILLQDALAKPAYILDRHQFLSEYGSLFEGNFDSASLKSIEKSDDKTVESYTIFDKENKPRAEARFELDRHKRLISIKVEPVQI